MKARYWRIRPEYTGPLDNGIDYWHICNYDMNDEWYRCSPLVIDSIKILDRNGVSLAPKANVIIKSYPENKLLDCIDGKNVGYRLDFGFDERAKFDQFYKQTQDYDQAYVLMMDFINNELASYIPDEFKEIKPEDADMYQYYLDDYIGDTDMLYYRLMFNFKNNNSPFWFYYLNGAHNSIAFDFGSPTDIGSLSLDFGILSTEFYNPDTDSYDTIEFRTNALLVVECSNDGNVWYTVGYNNPSDFDFYNIAPRTFQFINPISETTAVLNSFKYWGLKAFTWDIKAAPLDRVQVNEFKLLNEYGNRVLGTDKNWYKYQDLLDLIRTTPGTWYSIGPDDDINSYAINYPVDGNANESFTLPAACNLYEQYPDLARMSAAGFGYPACTDMLYFDNYTDRDLYLDIYTNDWVTFNAEVFINNQDGPITIDGMSLKFDQNHNKPRRVSVMAGDDWTRVQPSISKYEQATGIFNYDSSLRWLPLNMFSIITIDNVIDSDISISKLTSNLMYNGQTFNPKPIKITPEAYEVRDKKSFLVKLEL